MVQLIIEFSVIVVETPRSQCHNGIEQHLPRSSFWPLYDLVKLGSEGGLMHERIAAVVDVKIAIYQLFDDMSRRDRVR
jgi:hypothetical protein